MESSSFVSSFNIGGNMFYAKVDWVDNDTDLFHIQIYDRQDWWCGRFSKEFAETFRENAEEEDEEYRKNVKTSLMNKSIAVFEFTPISGDNAAAKFSWKKIYQGTTGPVLIPHGSVPIHKNTSPELNISLIDYLLNENKDLKKSIEDYELNILVLTGELDQSKAELERFVNIKSSLEMSVYGKFISLLNGKKRRIQLLEQNLHELENNSVPKLNELQ